MRIFQLYLLLVIVIAVCFALPKKLERIVGGSETKISNWPFVTSLLYTWNLATYSQACGGTIITKDAILSAAHCFFNDEVFRWRARVGSNYANKGGVVHKLAAVIIHENYNPATIDSDVAVIRTVNNINYNTNVQPAHIAGPTYNVEDNEIVWAMGWGATSFGAAGSDILKHVQIWTINQGICRARYAKLGLVITDNMLCSGWLNVGGRSQCQGDSGGPLVHGHVVIGITSWGFQCGSPIFPGVNVRVSRFSSWINSAAVAVVRH